MVVSLVLAVALVVQQVILLHQSPSSSSNNDGCMISFGTYHGHEYTTKEGGTVGTPKCLVESRWMKVQQHAVRVPNNSKLIDDWLWIDYHDRINVLVEDPASTASDRRFLVFEQTKYALEGKTSLAIIGGIIEPGEEPQATARREVQEEMGGLVCEQYHFLGRFRTDVNRGMGWVHSFLATQCSRPKKTNEEVKPSSANADEVGAADTERQDLQSITLKELREATLKGRFVEVQWSNTCSVAIHHIDANDANAR
jgi:ADP-ribose pyrophosphatase YjhB (NUDIX family)